MKLEKIWRLKKNISEKTYTHTQTSYRSSGIILRNFPSHLLSNKDCTNIYNAILTITIIQNTF